MLTSALNITSLADLSEEKTMKGEKAQTDWTWTSSNRHPDQCVKIFFDNLVTSRHFIVKIVCYMNNLLEKKLITRFLHTSLPYHESEDS